MRRLPILSFAVIAISFFIAAMEPAMAGVGDLLVAPTRVEFDARTRSQEITLVNRGTEEATYRISLQNMRMQEDGSYQEITEPGEGEAFADRLLRFAPRQVVLKPGETQTVRLLVRKPKDLADGEYRSHMLFRAVPASNAGTSIEGAEDEGKVSVRLVPVFGVSIPVILRQGKLTADISVREMEITTKKDKGERLNIAFVREGKKSVYGDIKVIQRNNGSELMVGQLRGVSLLAPYHVRRVEVPLEFPEGSNRHQGTLHMVLSGHGDEEGRVLAEKVITLK